MKTKEVAELLNCNKHTVKNWARKNNIKREMTHNGIMEYILSEEDVENFKKRENPGGYRRKNQ